MFSGQSSVIRGLLVDYGNVPERVRPPAMEKLESALGVIARYEPRRVERLVRDGTRIVLMTAIGAGSYHPASNVIFLDATWLSTCSIWQAALVIVHEAAHARMRMIAAGGRSVPRLERRCVEEEIAFYRRVPGVDQELLAQWEASKRATLNTPWWTFVAKKRTILRAIVSENPNPGWFVRLLRRLMLTDFK